ncbi:MAG: C-GCAxxG-C-C family protein [Salinivirgaceae bacterium]|jgi:C_GCAxxG_C_C family probable redox protein|nr:C-GCAxxG-C-C family protein [Salinivirgaceae bacterium]
MENKPTKSERARLAGTYFDEGYSCAQSIILGLADFTKLDQNTATNIAGAFGGGMGEAKSVCGVATGALMTLGLYEGRQYENLMHKNANIRLLADEFLKRFEAAQHTIDCPMIIQHAKKQGVRPHSACKCAVETGVAIVEDLLED